MKLFRNIENLIKGGIAMMINYFAMQVQLGWITLEQVPKRYREKVRELLELAEIGATEEKQETEG